MQAIQMKSRKNDVEEKQQTYALSPSCLHLTNHKRTTSNRFE